jgi:hypothetical protein
VDIRFCDQCDSSIPEADLERGAARMTGRSLLCASCRGVRLRAMLSRSVLLPLALLAVAALGAFTSVRVLRPQIEDLRSEVSELRIAVARVPPPDTGLADELRGLRSLMRENVAAQVGTQEAMLEAQAMAGRDLATAIETISDQMVVLAAETRAVKERVAALGESQPREPGGTDPGTLPGLDALLTMTEDTDSGIRFSALLEIADKEDPRVTKRVLSMLSDLDADVRSAAARILGERAVPAAITPLIGLLEDPKVLVRDEAAKALLVLTGEDFEYSATDPEAKRAKAITAFREFDANRGK